MNRVLRVAYASGREEADMYSSMHTVLLVIHHVYRTLYTRTWCTMNNIHHVCSMHTRVVCIRVLASMHTHNILRARMSFTSTRI